MTKINPAICHFCGKETSHVPLEKVSFIKIYFCYSCRAEYTQWGPVKASVFVHLYTTINDKVYRWTTCETSFQEQQEQQKQHGSIWYIQYPGLPGVRPNKGTKRLKEFRSNLPTITPDNVNAKLKFMLLFL